jgi:hypothetical protein
MLFPDVDGAAAGNCPEECRFSGPVLPDKKGHRPGKFYAFGLFENFQVKRVTICHRKGIVKQPERSNMHILIDFS